MGAAVRAVQALSENGVKFGVAIVVILLLGTLQKADDAVSHRGHDPLPTPISTRIASW